MIKVSYCVAYDWQLLRNSIPQIYEEADIICLSIDINRQSWSGSYFSWNEQGFRNMVKELDPLNKIIIYEDRFYDSRLLPMQNEVVQRNKIAEYIGKDGWHIQLDNDEYFIDFHGFVQFLRKLNFNRKINVCCPMVNLYKQLPEGILWIKPIKFQEIEFFPIATRHPHYEYGRRNGYFNVLTNYAILHQSWARSEAEIWEKLNNWGHAKDFDVSKYFSLWKEANSKNFKTYRNFHHLHPHTWPALELQPLVKSMENINQLGKNDFSLPLTKWELKKANFIWISRAKKVLSKLTG